MREKYLVFREEKQYQNKDLTKNFYKINFIFTIKWIIESRPYYFGFQREHRSALKVIFKLS